MRIKNVTHRMEFFKQYIFWSLIFLGSIESFAFQQDTLQQVSSGNIEITENKVEVYSAIREELHRYMGYEELLPKYISLPYDVSMNTNIGGAFVDIGYLFLLFFPILLLFGLSNKILKILTGVLMLVFLIISLPTGYRSNYLIRVDQVETQIKAELSQTSFSTAPLLNLKLQLTQLANKLYQPFQNKIINVFSGEGDSITYPIFFLLFLFSFYIINDKIKHLSQFSHAMAYFFLMYSFLWLILGAGVIWYGLLMLPLGLIFIGSDALKKQVGSNFLKYTFLFFCGLWIIGALSYRISNYSAPITESDRAIGGTQAELNKSAIHVGPLYYGLGEMSDGDLMEFLFPGYSPVLRMINDEANINTKIYRIGTYFQYFINRNDKRVLEDNQLAFFDNTLKLVPDKLQLVGVLKSQGYQYIIVDFNVASIDRTPDETLRKKAIKFEEFLQDNSGLEIIGTDRIVINGAGQQVYGLSGRKLIDRGSFVAYKLK